MNFIELCQLYVQHGNDREALAKALHMTPEQIDQLQLDAERRANELTPDTIVSPMHR